VTLTEEVCALLDELGVGTYAPDGPGGIIYGTALPDAPDVALAVARYDGGAEADSLGPWDEPRWQIRVRGAAGDSRTGEALAQAVYDVLHGLGYRYLTPGGTWLQLAICLNGGPGYIGRDQTGRHEWVVNVRTEVRRPTPNRPG
jgi:hypothetical protein